MNTKNIVSCFMIIALFCLASCEKELDAPVPFAFESGVLSTSKTEVVINAADPTGEAVTYSWSAFKNSLINNVLILTADGKTDTINNIAANTDNKLLKNSELNTILLDSLGLTVGVATDLKAVLVATNTTTGESATSNAVTIKVTPAAKGAAYAKLWIVGDATPSGWDVGNPREFTKDVDNDFQFKYYEVLTAGEFKIATALGSWGVDWLMPPTSHPSITSTAVTLIPGGNPDNKWLITNSGPYKILLNISPSPFIHIVPFTPYPTVSIVGDATAGGWDINKARVMTQDVNSPWIFIWTGALGSSGEGAFKFPLDYGNWGGSFIMAPVASSRLTTTKIVINEAGTSYPDNKFVVKPGEEGTYTITINQLYETISIVKQ
ncbi:SusF/SusE family outer membrane protein [Flavobacterium undicola]|uniref:SusF/SusE family outer membrane protein n=1 Tax=Flavobacterium undicola TaxID=1932779 RepID=UPI0015E1EE45|nr:SusF/SusE family outer membrane protein [Flavobacterium undicola]MBA0883404.1 SusF/SusE family outer membrane protein [Flavobacterium undicola]